MSHLFSLGVALDSIIHRPKMKYPPFYGGIFIRLFLKLCFDDFFELVVGGILHDGGDDDALLIQNDGDGILINAAQRGVVFVGAVAVVGIAQLVLAE